ncbi:MAG: PD40 domain-containing protein [Phycisphaerales bacterium]|nr:PD40 domain-containing protein [Phycisphaerales bacterium]
MFNKAVAMVAAVSVCSGLGFAGDGALIQYPCVSDDGRSIVFSAGGDLWAMDADGGAATRLTVHPGVETRSFFSPDGTMLCFESNRDGAQNIYTLQLEGIGQSMVGTDLSRVTVSDRTHTLGGFSNDGESVLFSASIYPEIYRHVSMFSAPVDGGPMESISDAFGRMPTASADGEWTYFNRGYFYPHRTAYRGPGNIDLWRMNKDGETFEQLTNFNGNDMNGHPLPDGSMVYLSSRDGQYNLWRLNADRTDISGKDSLRQITHFAPTDEEGTIAHGVRDLAVSADGSLAVFVVWNTMYSLDLTRSGAEPRVIDVLLSSDTERDVIDRIDISSKVSEAAIHPSGDAVVVSARGELFLRSTKDDRPTRRITSTPFREGSLAWSPDGSVLYFASDTADGLGTIFSVGVTLSQEDLVPVIEEEVVAEELDTEVDEEEDSEETESDDVKEEDKDSDESEEKSEEDEEEKTDWGKRWGEALRFEVLEVVKSEVPVYAPTPSPDGKTLLYKRERGDVFLRDLATGEDRLLFESWSDPVVHWVSDSRHVYYELTDLDFNSDIFLLDTSLDEDGVARSAVNISQHPDFDHSPQISHDGKVLTFLSDRDNQNWAFDVYAVFLDKSLEGMPKYALDEYFVDAAKAAKKFEPLVADNDKDDEDDNETAEEMTFDSDDAFLRIRRLTSTPESESELVMTPGGDRILFSTVTNTKREFVSVDHWGKDSKAVYSGSVGDVRMNINGTSVSFVASGKARKADAGGGKASILGIKGTIAVDRSDERSQKFHETAWRFGQSFYHPTLKGLDWDLITTRYDELTSYTRTKQSFQRLVNLMFGEVNGSHTGIWGGDGYSADSARNGYLGIDFTAVSKGYRIDTVLTGGVIDEMVDGPVAGDVIVSVNDLLLLDETTQSGLRDLHASLAGLAGVQVLIEYLHADDEGEEATRYGLVTPSSFGSASVMRYNNEVMRRRALVENRSNGRLGYLHIRSMGMASVRDFERDLYAAAHGKEGLVIDVRDNGGGWTTDILLASLTAPAHAYTIPRGANLDDVRYDNYPRDRRLIYAWNRPITVLINQHSFSNAEIFAHSIKTIGRGKIVGTQTFGGVISTGSFKLIDGTTVRRPFRGWYLPDGTDMESNGTIPDINVSQTPSDEVRGVDRQLHAAVDVMIEDLDSP